MSKIQRLSAIGIAATLGVFSLALVSQGIIQKYVNIQGKVVASFDEDHAIISTKTKLFRIATARVSPAMKRKMSQPFTEIKIKVPEDAIDLVWSLYPSPISKIPLAKIEEVLPALSKIKSHDGIVEIVGTRLPSIPADVTFVQVNDLIYVIAKEKLSPEAKVRVEKNRCERLYPAKQRSLFLEDRARKRIAFGS